MQPSDTIILAVKFLGVSWSGKPRKLLSARLPTEELRQTATGCTAPVVGGRWHCIASHPSQLEKIMGPY
jgi:hypothetical protein